MTTAPGANDALISNTMLCEVSRLLDDEGRDSSMNASWRRRVDKSLRATDLLSLIEAVTLHETLYTLPARLANDVQSLRLRSELVARGIIRELDTSTAHEGIARSILTGLSKIKDPVRVAGSAQEIGTPIEFTSRMRGDIAEFLLILDEAKRTEREQERIERATKYGIRPETPPLLDDTYDFFGEGGGSSQPLHASSFEGCGRALIGWIEYHGSGAYEHCTSIMRDMYYVFAAESFSLPYWPESTRRSFTSRFPNFFDKATLLQLYSRLSDAFRATVTDVFDDHKGEVAFVPPFAALVLERSSGRGEIIARILELRDEYANLRRRFEELESERREAASIEDRLKIRKRQRYLLNEVASAFVRPSMLNLEGVVRYIPNMVGPATNPTDPSTYSADLLVLPAKKLLTWWRRRPISKFFDLADKLKEIKSYEQLLQRVFGEDIDIGYIRE